VARFNVREALCRQACFSRFNGERVGHLHVKGDENAAFQCVGCFGQTLEHVVPNGLWRVLNDAASAAGAVELCMVRKKQLDVIVELRHCAYRRARRSHGAVLVDGDGGRHAFYAFDVRPVHAVKELACVRTEGFNVAALAFRIKRVEDERAFAGTGEPRYDGEFSGAQIQINVLQVVLPGPADADKAFGRRCVGHAL